MFRAIANSVCDTRDFLSGHSPNQKTEKACHKDLPAAALWQAGTKAQRVHKVFLGSDSWASYSTMVSMTLKSIFLVNP